MVGYAITMESANTASPTYLKAGGTKGYSAFVIWKREPGIGVVILANKSGLDSGVLPEIAKAIMKELE
jgi:hypothetical protein